MDKPPPSVNIWPQINRYQTYDYSSLQINAKILIALYNPVLTWDTMLHMAFNWRFSVKKSSATNTNKKFVIVHAIIFQMWL